MLTFTKNGEIYRILLIILVINNIFVYCVGSKLKIQIVLIQEDPSIEFGGKSDPASSSSETGRKSVNDNQNHNRNHGHGTLVDFILRNNPIARKKFLTEKILPTKPNSDVVLSQNVIQDSVQVRLECSSNSPVIWTYTGHGHPPMDISSGTQRTFTDFYKPETYEYSATLNFPTLPNEQSTGNYTCKSLMDDSHSFFYIYVPGPKFFVSESGQTVHVNVREKSFVIPCSTSGPNVETLLFKTETMNHPERVVNPHFDPKTGFSLSYTDPYSIELASINSESPFGEYVCTGGNDSMTSSIIVNVETPKELVVKPIVKSNYVYLEQNIKQRFICEGKKNMTFTFTPTMSTFSPEIIYQFNPTSEFPFVSTFIADPTYFPSNHSLVHCVVQKINSVEPLNSLESQREDGKILHTWEYSNLGNDRRLKFLYDKKSRGFLCCSENSYMAPEMIPLRPCSSPIECDLRNYHNPNIYDKGYEEYVKSFQKIKGRNFGVGVGVGAGVKNKANYNSNINPYFNHGNDNDNDNDDEEVEVGNIFTDTLTLSLKNSKSVSKSSSNTKTNSRSRSNRNEFDKSQEEDNAYYTDSTLQIPKESLPKGCSGFRKSPTSQNYQGYFRCSIQNGEEKKNIKDYFYAVIDGEPIIHFDDITPRHDVTLVKIHYPKENSRQSFDHGHKGYSPSPSYGHRNQDDDDDDEEDVNINGGRRRQTHSHSDSRTHTPAVVVTKGQEVEIYCEPNKFFFAQGHVLAFERSNGSLEIIPKELMRDQGVIISEKARSGSGSETYFPKRIRTLIFPDDDIVRLHCFAPMYRSSEWRSSSLSIQVRDDPA